MKDNGSKSKHTANALIVICNENFNSETPNVKTIWANQHLYYALSSTTIENHRKMEVSDTQASGNKELQYKLDEDIVIS